MAAEAKDQGGGSSSGAGSEFSQRMAEWTGVDPATHSAMEATFGAGIEQGTVTVTPNPNGSATVHIANGPELTVEGGEAAYLVGKQGEADQK
jgi:hypothetical protein